MMPGSPMNLDHNNGQVVYCQDASKHVVLISTSWLNTVCLHQRGMGLLLLAFVLELKNTQAPLSREEQHHKMFWFSGILNWWSLSHWHWPQAWSPPSAHHPSPMWDVREICQMTLGSWGHGGSLHVTHYRASRASDYVMLESLAHFYTPDTSIQRISSITSLYNTPYNAAILSFMPC